MEGPYYDDIFRVVILGDSGVGKTNLTQCFFRNDPNFRSTTPTIGIEYSAPMMDLCDHRHVKLQIWDTAGQEQYRAMTTDQLRKAQGSLVLFDITSHKSFEAVPYWVDCLHQKAMEGVQIMLVGNKIDKAANRAVSRDQAENLAAKLAVPYRETTITDLATVRAVFKELAEKIGKVRNRDDHRGQSDEFDLKGSRALVKKDAHQLEQKGCC